MMDKKTRYLRGYLLIFGLLNIFVISFTIPLLFGDWLLWEPRNQAVEMMMSSIYLAMGIVMMLIARDPLPHKAFIDFLVSPDGQRIFAEQNYEYPVLSGVSLRESVQPLDEYRLADVNVAAATLAYDETFELIERVGLP